MNNKKNHRGSMISYKLGISISYIFNRINYRRKGSSFHIEMITFVALIC